MIERRAVDALMVSASLPMGAIAFLDADWIPRDPGPAAALVVLPDGTVFWSPQAHICAQGIGAPEGLVGLIFDTLSREAAEAVASVPTELIQIRGRGLVSSLIRRRLGIPQTPARIERLRARAIIDTTGDPASIVAAAKDVDDLGLVVLAGGTCSGPVSLDFYPDVHARGLRIVGVPPTIPAGVAAQNSESNRLAQLIEESARRSQLNTPLPPDALIYRVCA